MAFFFRTQLFLVLLFVLFTLLQVSGHSYLTAPISRSNQQETLRACRGNKCKGPCDAPISGIYRTAITTSRSNSVNVQWPRNNHPGGFVRLAWAPTSQSDNHAEFDSHVQQINCFEIGGCQSSDPSNLNGADNGTYDGSVQPCQTTIQIPLDLSDGLWTLQWAYFGGGVALGDYYSCVDYKVSGGPNGTHKPVFIGGDVSFPGQPKCKFFNADTLHQCVTEPCSNATYAITEEQNGPPPYVQRDNETIATSGSSIKGSTTSSLTTGSQTSTTGSQTSTTGSRVLTTESHTSSPSPSTASMTSGRVTSSFGSSSTPLSRTTSFVSSTTRQSTSSQLLTTSSLSTTAHSTSGTSSFVSSGSSTGALPSTTSVQQSITSRITTQSASSTTGVRASLTSGVISTSSPLASVSTSGSSTTGSSTTGLSTSSHSTTNPSTTTSSTTSFSTSSPLTTGSSTATSVLTTSFSTSSPLTTSLLTTGSSTANPSITTSPSTTAASTTDASTTAASTTAASTTDASSTAASSTDASTTAASSTDASTTDASTTDSSTTYSSTTSSSTTSFTSGSSNIPSTSSYSTSQDLPSTSSASVLPTQITNCAGSYQKSASQAFISAVNVWETGFHATVDIDIIDEVLTNWALEITWPNDGHATQVTRTFNAAELSCQDKSQAVFRPVNWSITLNSGSTISVEVIADNSSEMSSAYLIANTKLRVLKKI